MSPTPTVYIPTLEGGERLAACLESLRQQTVPVEVVVADNGSGEGCLDLIESRFPEVIRVAFGRNLGFGRALNRAIAKAGTGPIILLNDDAVARADFVEALLAAADGVEMVAAVLLNERHPDRIDSAGIMVDQTVMAFDYLSGESVDLVERVPDPTGPTGGGALYSREAFEDVNGFDENIFLYYEDVDLALRVSARGGRCRLARNARAVHGYSETLGARSPRKYAMTGWSRGYLLRRYGIMRNPRQVSGVLIREAVVCAGQLVRDRTTAGLRGRLRGWRDGRGLIDRKLPAGTVTRMSARKALMLRQKHADG